MACVGYINGGNAYVIQQEGTPSLSLQIYTIGNSKAISTITSTSTLFSSFTPGAACAYYYPNLYISGTGVSSSDSTSRFNAVAVVPLGDINAGRTKSFYIYNVDLPTESSAISGTSTGTEKAATPTSTQPVEDTGGGDGTTVGTPLSSDNGSQNSKQPHGKRDPEAGSYTMIAPINATLSSDQTVNCFALGSSGLFQTRCSDQTDASKTFELYKSDSTFASDMISFLSYNNGNRLFVLMKGPQSRDYQVAPALARGQETPLQPQGNQNLPPPTLYTFDPEQDLPISSSKLFVYNNTDASIKALWVPEQFDGSSINFIESTSASDKLSLKTYLFDQSSPIIGVDKNNVGITIDPTQANGGTMYIASKSIDPGANGAMPYSRAVPSFSALQQTPFDSNSAGPNAPTPTEAAGSNGSSNNAGTIAGAVVGSVVGVALIIAALIFCLKKRRARSREFESLSRGGEKSQASSAAAWPFVGGNSGSAPVKQYGDISNVSNVRQMDVNSAELEALEPSSPLADGSVVLGGLYQFTRDSPSFLDSQQSRIPKYAMRGVVYQNGGQTSTLHYFITPARDAFIRNVTTTVALANSPRVIEHRDAIAMSHPTRRSGYQYLWITEPCLPQQSLHYVLTGSDTTIDISEYAFKAWSTFAMLEALTAVHAASFVHLGLTPYSFYYTDIDQVSDWKITGFDQTHRIGERVSEAHLNQWSAPELFATASSDNRRCYRQTVQAASDIWSLGCVIYTLATGRNLTIDLNQTAQLSRRDRDQLYIHVTSACNEAGSVNDSYRTLLEGMLHPDPARRSTAANLAAYWKESNGLYDDDEEENNEAEESMVTP